MTKEEVNRRMILQYPSVRRTPGVMVRITLKKLPIICSSELQGREEEERTLRSVMMREFPSGLSESQSDPDSMTCFFLDLVPSSVWCGPRGPHFWV